MPRAKFFGWIALLVSLVLGGLFFYYAFYLTGFRDLNLTALSDYSYYALILPIALVALVILGTGFWIGWTILTIKVAPPMPEIVEKKDFAKVKAFLLCLVTLSLSALFIYGIYLRSYWALAVPAAAVTLVVLGMIFWVGVAIITTRTTLP